MNWHSGILATTVACGFGLSVSALAVRGASSSAAGADIFGRNLVVNGSGEQNAAVPGGRDVVPIDGWKVEGNLTLVPYAAPDLSYGGIMPGSPIPPHGGKNFFAGGPDNAASSASQVIDIGVASASIDAGKVRYLLSAYLGGDRDQDDRAALSAVFRDAQGAALREVTVGPVLQADRGPGGGVLFRQAVGFVPAGARSILVKLAMMRVAGRYNDGYADEISLVLSGPGQPEAVSVVADGPPLLGRNLVVNPSGEQNTAVPGGRDVVPIDGWKVEGNLTLVPYAAPDPAYGGIMPGGAIPSDAGQNFFAGGPDNAASSATQVVDVAAAAALIDAGEMKYSLSGYFGGDKDQDDHAALSAVFRNAQGITLGEATVGPVLRADLAGSGGGLLLREATGPVPSGTRSILVRLAMTRVAGRYNDGYADKISLVLSDAEPGSAPLQPGDESSSGHACPKILAEFLRFMAEGNESRAFALATDRLRNAPAVELQGVRQMARALAETSLDGVDAIAISPTVTQLMVGVKHRDGRNALLVAEFVNDRIDRFDWRACP